MTDKATQRKLNVINVSLFTPALLFSKVSASSHCGVVLLLCELVTVLDCAHKNTNVMCRFRLPQ